MFSQMIFAATAAVIVPEVIGDFDGDGLADTVIVRTDPGGEQHVLVRFGSGASAGTAWRQGGAAALRLVPAADLAGFYRKSAPDVDACRPRAVKRDGFAFTVSEGKITAVGLWTGKEVLLIAGLTMDRGQPFLAFRPSPTDKAASDSAPRHSPAEEAATELKLTIDPSGIVAACQVAVSSGDTALDNTACAVVLGKTRYRPALDATGKPTGSVQRLRVSWRGAGAAAITPPAL